MLQVEYNGHALDVFGRYEPGEPQQWTTKGGDPGTPGSGPSFEVELILYKGLDITDLFNELVDPADLESIILEQHY